MTPLAPVLKSWLAPSGVVALIGLIIWLVQLNFHALQSTEKNGQQDILQQEILTKQVEVSQNLIEATLILDLLTEEVRAMRAKVDQHQIDSEKWKEKIRTLENEMSTYGE